MHMHYIQTKFETMLMMNVREEDSTGSLKIFGLSSPLVTLFLAYFHPETF